jgi:SAM-dependent methyltransferase
MRVLDTALPRIGRIFAGIDIDKLTGLEIGPLDKPLVPRNGRRSIFYGDYADRKFLQEQSANNPHVNVDRIVETDFILKPPIPDDLGRKFGYVVAAHVVEHVPDVLGWLHTLARWLNPGGVITLATPDYRYCFDRIRRPSIVGDFIQAFLEKRQRPTPSLVYDGFRNAVKYEPTTAWSTDALPSSFEHYYTEETAMWLAKRAMDEYMDCHCWVWTADSFKSAFEELVRLKLTDLKLIECHGPYFNEAEFYVKFQSQ